MIKVNNHTIKDLEHLVHYKNLKSILERGILSHNKTYELKLISEDISMNEVQELRRRKKFDLNGKTLSVHDFASFYFNSRNPMLFKRKNIQDEILIILISPSILDTKITDERFSIFSNGNAGSGSTKFFSGKNNLQHLDLDLIYGDSWNHDDEDIKKENRRKRCAEVLIYPFVPTSDIIKIICPNQKMNNHAKELVIDNKIRSQKSHIEIETNPFYFF